MHACMLCLHAPPERPAALAADHGTSCRAPSAEGAHALERERVHFSFSPRMP